MSCPDPPSDRARVWLCIAAIDASNRGYGVLDVRGDTSSQPC